MGHLTETHVAPGVWMGTLGGDTAATSYGANAVAVAGEHGTLLIDPLIAPAHARLCAEALAARGFPPVTQVFVTHHHTDHALGASFFAAPVSASRACAAAMATEHPGIIASRRAQASLAALFADAEARVPTAIFDDRAELDLGGLAVELRRVGPAHTPGDAIAWIPSARIVIAGDLLFHGYHVNFEDADMRGLDAALRGLLALDATIYIPGHGPPGGREIVEAQLRYNALAGDRDGLLRRYPAHLLRTAAGSSR